jgi:hypothetical protein
VRKQVALAAVAGGLAWASAASAEPSAGELRALREMTPDAVASAVTVKDDALELEATITTEKAFTEKHGLLGVVWNDVFVRAFVDKKTGRSTYQIFGDVTYRASAYYDYHEAHYQVPGSDEPASADLKSLLRRTDCTRHNLLAGGLLAGQCFHLEQVAFEVGEPVLRAIAAGYTPSPASPATAAWHFRFKSQAGVDFDAFLMPAEIAGAFLAVDRYRKDHGLGAPPAR